MVSYMKDKTILLSVIVCTYNRVSLLKKCLSSIKKQTASVKNYEVVVVDNSSTDSTKEMFKEYAKNRTNIRIVTEKNVGRSNARNRGWQEAKGKYVAYVDDDAIVKSDWLEKIIAFINKYPKIKVFGGPYDRYSIKQIPAWLPEKYFTLDLGGKLKKLNLKNEWLSGSNMIFNRSIFNKYGGFNTNFGGVGEKIFYGEETEFFTRLKKKKEPVYYVPTIRIKHLVTGKKLHLLWLLRNDYAHSFSNSLIIKRNSNFLRGIVSLILAIVLFPIYLVDVKKGVIKRRLYVGLSNIFSSFGQMAGSIYDLRVRLSIH